MAKDPAFLMYSKDWLEGTAEYMPEEKGVYIDLLCFQHQRGGLPNDPVRLAKMVGLSEERFNKIWSVISIHFDRMDDRLVNRRLQAVMTERSRKSLVNTITGTFAGLLRLGKYDKKQYQHLKNQFKVSDFISNGDDKEWLTDRLTEWIQECLKSIEDGNNNNNSNYIKLFKKVVTENNLVIAPEIEKLFLEWLRYKSEKNQTYKETGLKNFIIKTLQECNNDPAEFKKMIMYSTSNNYDGLFKEKKHENNSRDDQRRTKRTDSYWVRPNSVPAIQDGNLFAGSGANSQKP